LTPLTQGTSLECFLELVVPLKSSNSFKFANPN
jgi:hypothetical protein